MLLLHSYSCSPSCVGTCMHVAIFWRWATPYRCRSLSLTIHILALWQVHIEEKCERARRKLYQIGGSPSASRLVWCKTPETSPPIPSFGWLMLIFVFFGDRCGVCCDHCARCGHWWHSDCVAQLLMWPPLHWIVKCKHRLWPSLGLSQRALKRSHLLKWCWYGDPFWVLNKSWTYQQLWWALSMSVWLQDWTC